MDGLEEHEVGEDVLDEAEVRHRDVEVGPWNIGQLGLTCSWLVPCYDV